MDFPLESGFAIGELAAPARRLVVRLYDTQREPLHPALVLPDFDDANPALVGHPLLAALESIDIDVQIFVEFRYFAVDNQGPTKGAIAPLAGVTVAVHDDVLGDVLDSGTTDADGRASFFVSNWDWVGTADLFFKVSIPYPERDPAPARAQRPLARGVGDAAAAALRHPGHSRARRDARLPARLHGLVAGHRERAARLLPRHAGDARRART